MATSRSKRPSGADDFNDQLQAVLTRSASSRRPQLAAVPAIAVAVDPPLAADRRRSTRPSSGSRPPRPRCPRASPSTRSWQRQLAARAEQVRPGEVDWALGEALASARSSSRAPTCARRPGHPARDLLAAPRGVRRLRDRHEYIPLCRRREAPPASAHGARHAPSASTRPSASSTATPSSAPRRWSPGRRSSATS